jgi:hypothetical protein
MMDITEQPRVATRSIVMRGIGKLYHQKQKSRLRIGRNPDGIMMEPQAALQAVDCAQSAVPVFDADD